MPVEMGSELERGGQLPAIPTIWAGIDEKYIPIEMLSSVPSMSLSTSMAMSIMPPRDADIPFFGCHGGVTELGGVLL